MQSTDADERPLNILILAAGMGSRMKSDRAKVLHSLDGRPLIEHVCKTAISLHPKRIFVVVGHQSEEVKRVVADAFDENIDFVLQKRQLGTGDAVNAAREQQIGRASCRERV